MAHLNNLYQFNQPGKRLLNELLMYLITVRYREQYIIVYVSNIGVGVLVSIPSVDKGPERNIQGVVGRVKEKRCYKKVAKVGRIRGNISIGIRWS